MKIEKFVRIGEKRNGKFYKVEDYTPEEMGEFLIDNVEHPKFNIEFSLFDRIFNWNNIKAILQKRYSENCHEMVSRCAESLNKHIKEEIDRDSPGRKRK